MPRYYDMDELAAMIRAKADTLIEGKEAFFYVAKWLDLLPAADVVPKRQVDLSQYLLTDAWKRIEELGELCGELQKFKSETTIQIFEDIEKIFEREIKRFPFYNRQYLDLKMKYTQERKKP